MQQVSWTAPATSQRVVRKRATMPTKRASIHSDSAPHSQSRPPSSAGDQQRGREVDADRRDQHRQREVAGVAGADEHAVEHEHDRGERLQRGDDPEHLEGEVAHARDRW